MPSNTLTPEEVKISASDQRLLHDIAVNVAKEFMAYGSLTLHAERGLSQAFGLGFTAVNRMEAEGQEHPPKPDWMVDDDTALKEGAWVQWTSQSHGYQSTKIGTIAEVVCAGSKPNRKRFPYLYKGAECGAPRSHTSYVVEVHGKYGNLNKPYWPIASKLSRCEPPEDGGQQ